MEPILRRYMVAGLSLLFAVGGCRVSPSDLPEPQPAPAFEVPWANDIVAKKFVVPLSLQDAEAILEKTTFFSLHAPSPAIDAYNMVLNQPDALDRFHRLSQRGQSAGQLFALCGLRHLRSDSAGSLAKRLSTISDRIFVFEGGTTNRKSVSELTSTIEAEEVWLHFRESRSHGG
jgi:hypothetical protein